MPGLPKEIFLDQALVGRYLCCICSLVFRDAVQSPCGHRYCNSCIKEKIKNGLGQEQACPACPENSSEGVLTIEEVCPDFVVRRELKSASVICVNEGCNWSGHAQEYIQLHEDSCPYQKIKCLRSGCGKTVKRRDLSNHLEKECPMRATECKYCKKQYPFKEAKKHDCPHAPANCSSCNKRVSRSQMERHMDPDIGDCPKRKTKCIYYPLGCSTKLVASNMEEHLCKNVVEHNILVVNAIFPKQFLMKGVSEGATPMEGKPEESSKVRELYFEENLARNVGEMFIGKVEDSKGTKNTKDSTGLTDGHSLEAMLKQEMMKCSKDIQHLSKDLDKKLAKVTNDLAEREGKSQAMIAVLDHRTETLQQVLAVLSNELEAVHSKASALQQQNVYLKEFTEKQEKRLHSQDQMLTLKNIALAEQELRIQALESSSYDGVLLWRISEIKRRRGDAVSGKTTSFYSPVFHTSRHGYKLSARVYLNGDGLGKHTHMSLFFVVMRGRHDALLQWPFQQKVTFMLMNQSSPDHIVDAFRPDPASSSFKKPTSDMNIASGCPLFITQELLDSCDNYIKDDTMFVKVIVDTAGLEKL